MRENERHEERERVGETERGRREGGGGRRYGRGDREVMSQSRYHHCLSTCPDLYMLAAYTTQVSPHICQKQRSCILSSYWKHTAVLKKKKERKKKEKRGMRTWGRQVG